MKMNRRAKMIFIAVLSMTLLVGYTVKQRGLGFVAPGVNGTGNVYEPQTGEIVYDSALSKFFGYANDVWIELSAGDSVVPTGTILPFAGTTAPAGYLMANGAPISRTTYTNLFTAIGTAYGIGDNSTTFNLPDLRGRFLRGVDGTAGNDPDSTSRTASNGGNSGNNVGSLQGDAFKSHNHGVYVGLNNNNNGSNYLVPMANNNEYGTRSTSSSGGNESRPKNIYVNYIIKL